MENCGRDFRSLCPRLDHGCPERDTGFIFRWRKIFSDTAGAGRGPKNDRHGANIIDVGGESTRPGAEPVDVAEEKRRVIPIIEELAGETLISIDTSKAEVAAAALDAGAKIVNDVTGGRGDDAMWPLLAKRGAAFIIMHMQGTPPTMQRAPFYRDVVAEVADFFRQQYACAIKFGLDPMTLAFDPGIGFGKTLEHNLSLLKNLPRLRINDRPTRRRRVAQILSWQNFRAQRLDPQSPFANGRLYFALANERGRCFARP